MSREHGHLQAGVVPVRAACGRTRPTARASTTSDGTSFLRSSTRIRCSFPFTDPSGQQAYWRDVGTIDAYYQANVDMLRARPQLDLHDGTWPVRTFQPNSPPPKFVWTVMATSD
ncbi:MAG: hypothetical protein R3B96_12905 [Pirellulaceae bacterium]